MEDKKHLVSSEQITQLLDKLYETAINGIPKVSPPISTLVSDYTSKHETIEKAAKSFIKYQVAKCATSGFATGLGGIITLPVTVPANISSVLYVQMRMIAALAEMGGFDTNSDQVQALVYACLVGISVDQILKNFGIQFGVKFTNAMVKKIPGTFLTKINQKVGFRFVTKSGTTGLINLTKMLPIVGGVIGGTMDLVETEVIAKRAYKLFLEGDVSCLQSDEDDIVVDEKPIDSDNSES